MKFDCPVCLCSLEFADDAAGTAVKCVKCRSKITVPSLPPPLPNRSVSAPDREPPTPPPIPPIPVKSKRPWHLRSFMLGAAAGGIVFFLLGCLIGGVAVYSSQRGGGLASAGKVVDADKATDGFLGMTMGEVRSVMGAPAEIGDPSSIARNVKSLPDNLVCWAYLRMMKFPDGRTHMGKLALTFKDDRVITADVMDGRTPMPSKRKSGLQGVHGFGLGYNHKTMADVKKLMGEPDAVGTPMEIAGAADSAPDTVCWGYEIVQDYTDGSRDKSYVAIHFRKGVMTATSHPAKPKWAK